MKLNIAFPATGAQKLIDVEDDKKLRGFYEKRIAAEVEGDTLGPEYKGYVFKIMGGNDKQGFPMKQGVLVAGRVRLLLGEGSGCYRPGRSGERRRKSVRGCIVGADLAVLHLVVIKKGEQEIAGLTDRYLPRRLGPKRATKIRKLFNLSKLDDVRKYVIRRELPAKEGKKKKTVAPKIQRLVTPLTLQRRRHRIALKKRRAEASKAEAETYAKLIAQRRKDQREKSVSKRVSSKRASTKEGEPKAAPAPKKADAPKAAAPAKKADAPKPAAPAKKADAPKKAAAPKKK